MTCKHVNTNSRLSALDDGGRYYCRTRGRWVCPWCGTDAPGTAEEWAIVEVSRREDCSYADAAALVTPSDVAEARRAYGAESA